MCTISPNSTYSNRLVRFEALARWTHPTLSVISPAKFSPVAEESGLIVPLAAYIMELACIEALKWQALTLSPIQVAVNVSSIQFKRDRFVEEVVEVLDRTGLSRSLSSSNLRNRSCLAASTGIGNNEAP